MGMTGPRFPALDEPFPPPFPLPFPGPPPWPWPLSCPWPLLLGVPVEAPLGGLLAPVFLLPSAPVFTVARSVARGACAARGAGNWGREPQFA
jgi:hypothetical protein